MNEPISFSAPPVERDLVAGIAHDLNNFLQPLLSILETLEADPDLAPGHRKSVGVMRSAANRSQALVEHLLSLRGDGVISPEPQDLNALLLEMESLLAYGFPPGVSLVLELDPRFPPFAMNPIQLQRIMLNLVKNARDAMEGPGRITVRTYRIHVGASESAGSSTPPGAFGCLEVQDEGKGIESGDLERIFEPFFTTKGPGRGTGLGLSVAVSAAKAHGGFVRCLSEPGRGACFQVFFPLEGVRK